MKTSRLVAYAKCTLSARPRAAFCTYLHELLSLCTDHCSTRYRYGRPTLCAYVSQRHDSHHSIASHARTVASQPPSLCVRECLALRLAPETVALAHPRPHTPKTAHTQDRRHLSRV
eukprot:scaffold187038_cov29-Tisochrysis_lutea.AAC.1